MKKQRQTNFHVDIEPDRMTWSRDEERIDSANREACRGIAEQVKRHIDNIGSVQVLWDVEVTCSFCGSRWTEDSDTFNGGCCCQDAESDPDAVKPRRAGVKR